MNVVIEELLLEKPDGILTVSDRLALACLAALKNRQIKIPESIAMIGFTNLKVAELLSPSLSTIVQPAFEMGQKSVELLLDLIEKKPKQNIIFEKFMLPTEIIIRESSLGKQTN